MLCRRKIDLPAGASNLSPVVITVEMLGESIKASQWVERAKSEADHLLCQAAEQRDALLEQTQMEFWQRANAQLKQWERQRQAMCDHLEPYAASIANLAYCSLLDETPPAQRLSALIKQLLTTQIPTVRATLLCHPLERDSLEQCLAMLSVTHWALRCDDAIKPHSLALETDEGDFRIDWASLREILLTREKEVPGQ